MMNRLRVLVAVGLLFAVVEFAGFIPFDSSPIVAAAADNAKQADLLDINTATAGQLKALPGIGDAYTEKIIKGRPYQRKDELVQKQILPRAAYQGIKCKIMTRIIEMGQRAVAVLWIRCESIQRLGVMPIHIRCCILNSL